MRKNDIEKIVGASSARMEKMPHPDSNRDPPAYAADCSAVDLLRPGPDTRAREHLNHLASASGQPHRRDLSFLHFPTGPPRSDPQTRAVKEDIN